MTAIDAWERLLTDLANLIPTPLRRTLTPYKIRAWAERIHACVLMSATGLGALPDCECRTGGHRAGCRRAS